MTKTKADELAEFWKRATPGQELPKRFEQEALAEEVQEVQENQIAKISCLVRKKGSEEVKADIVVNMPAFILAGETLRYFEIAATSDSTAHAICGAVADKVQAEWKIKVPGLRVNDEPGWAEIELSKNMIIRDTRLEVPGWGGRLIHHCAMLDRDNALIIADSDETLWKKLRIKLSCPTLYEWGPEILPRIRKSDILQSTVTHGISEGFSAYVLAPDANDLFDKIISQHVKRNGLPERKVA